VVFGGGPVGLLVGYVLRHRGVPTVIVEPNPARSALLERAGFATEPPVDGTVSSAFECSGHPAAFDAALAALGRGGAVVVIGTGEAPLSFTATALIAKELDVRAAVAYSVADFGEAVDLLARGAVPGEVVITGEVGMDEAPAVMRALSALSGSRPRSAGSPPRR
jgi:threonine dehydrogenase-like Zn-dependent dehydrogenase